MPWDRLPQGRRGLEPAFDRDETSRASSALELEHRRGIQTADLSTEPARSKKGFLPAAQAGLLERTPTLCAKKRRRNAQRLSAALD